MHFLCWAWLKIQKYIDQTSQGHMIIPIILQLKTWSEFVLYYLNYDFDTNMS